MSEPLLARSPLVTFLKHHIGANRSDKPGLIIKEQQRFALLQLIARQHDPAQLSRQVTQYLNRQSPLAPLHGAVQNGLLICATAPLEYWVLAQKPPASETPEVIEALIDLQALLEPSASIFDQSEGRLVIALTGDKAPDVLTKGTALDLHAKAFPAIGATHTVIEHIPALLSWQSDPRQYHICVPRSYAHSFMTWLCEAASDVGYVIKT